MGIFLSHICISSVININVFRTFSNLQLFLPTNAYRKIKIGIFNTNLYLQYNTFKEQDFTVELHLVA